MRVGLRSHLAEARRRDRDLLLTQLEDTLNLVAALKAALLRTELALPLAAAAAVLVESAELLQAISLFLLFALTLITAQMLLKLVDHVLALSEVILWLPRVQEALHLTDVGLHG